MTKESDKQSTSDLMKEMLAKIEALKEDQPAYVDLNTKGKGKGKSKNGKNPFVSKNKFQGHSKKG